MDLSSGHGLLLAGSASGILMAGWSYIKGFFIRLLSSVIATTELSTTDSTEAFYLHCWKQYKRIPLGEKKYSAETEYVRPLNRRGLVAFERASNKLTFFKGLAPIFISTDISNGAVKTTVSYLRGTYDFKSEFVKAIDSLDAIKHSEEKTNSRYRVYKLFGYNGISQKTETESASKSVSPDAVGMTASELKLPIKWKKDELGSVVRKEPFNRLAYSEEVDTVIRDIKTWHSLKDFYESRGLNWRFGVELRGLPGTGKSSFAAAIGMDLDMPIFALDLTTMSNKELSKQWEAVLNNTPCIALFEDIDRIFDENKRIIQPSAGQGITLDCLLNCLSGVEGSNGVLTLMTVNHPERLDPALTRKGRMERQLTFGYLSQKNKEKVAERILNGYPDLISAVLKNEGQETGADFESRCQDLLLSTLWKKDTLQEEPTLTLSGNPEPEQVVEKQQDKVDFKNMI